MPESTLPERVTVLEQKVDELVSLPSRVGALELQIVQLRDEMHVGFSAVRQEMAVMRDDLRTELKSTAESLRAEIRESDEETRRYMRVLHEDVIARISALGDARR
jgi:hypothetical protein